jgi:hypothetical protein
MGRRGDGETERRGDEEITPDSPHRTPALSPRRSRG